MFRYSLFALAASLMALGSFATTVAAVSAGVGAGVPVEIA